MSLSRWQGGQRKRAPGVSSNATARLTKRTHTCVVLRCVVFGGGGGGGYYTIVFVFGLIWFGVEMWRLPLALLGKGRTAPAFIYTIQ